MSLSDRSGKEFKASFSASSLSTLSRLCYFCQLGELEKAKDYLRRAFEIDLGWREMALDDKDLEPL